MLSKQFEVSVYNRTPRTPPEGCRLVQEDSLAQCDVLFLCVSIRAVGSVCERLAPILSSQTVVADTCSVKRVPVETMCRLLPEDIPVLGTHPMFGPDSVADHSHSLPVVVTPGRNSEGAERAWMRHFSNLGLDPRHMSVDDHDREAARTQGITHLVGRILGELDLPDSAIATTGYRRLQQLVEQTCNDPYELFEDLWRLNPHAPQAREEFERSVSTVLGWLDNADT
ncbi:MAG: prephenate dehydrogenase/arogenate dehydrogenase family protein [bacterium]